MSTVLAVTSGPDAPGDLQWLRSAVPVALLSLCLRASVMSARDLRTVHREGKGRGTVYCSGIGNSDHDDTANRRLLKCIASSTAGTNDHYFEVPNADDLPAVFDQIAREIAFRLIK